MTGRKPPTIRLSALVPAASSSSSSSSSVTAGPPNFFDEGWMVISKGKSVRSTVTDAYPFRGGYASYTPAAPMTRGHGGRGSFSSTDGSGGPGGDYHDASSSGTYYAPRGGYRGGYRGGGHHRGGYRGGHRDQAAGPAPGHGPRKMAPSLHTKPLVDRQETEIIKATIVSALKENSDIAELIVYAKDKLDGKAGARSQLSKPAAAKFIETLISWSVHELFQDEWLRNELQKIHEADKQTVLHWAIWARWKTKPNEMTEIHAANTEKKIPLFVRTEDDILETIKLCMVLGTTPVERNGVGETAFASLQKFYSKGNISEATYNKAYLNMTNPPEEVKQRICCMVANKITHNFNTQRLQNINRTTTTTEREAPKVPAVNAKEVEKTYVEMLSWLVEIDCERICRMILDNLVAFRKGVRDKDGYYVIVHERIKAFSDLLNKGPTVDGKSSDFKDFFASRRSSRIDLINKFKHTLMTLCIKFSLALVIEGQNFDIIGAIIGEVASHSAAMEYASKLMKTKNSSVGRTCLIHMKSKDAHFICDKKIITDMVDEYEKEKESCLKFHIIGTLQILTGKKLVSADISKLRLSFEDSKKEGKTPQSLSYQESDDDSDKDSDDNEDKADDDDKDIGDGFEANPYFSKVIIMTSLKKLKVTEEIKLTPAGWVPTCVDDIAYGLEKLLSPSKDNVDAVLEIYILRCAEIDTVDAGLFNKQIEAMTKIFIASKNKPAIKKIITEKRSKILSLFSSRELLRATVVLNTLTQS